jgi:carnitine 3-dehydrogenase
LDAVVRSEWVDYNHHMTDFRYGQLFGDAMDSLYRRVGVDEAYRASGRMYYSVESHVRHLGQAVEGEMLYVTTQLLNVDEKRLHVLHRVHRGRDDALIATGEQMHLHVDTGAVHTGAVHTGAVQTGAVQTGAVQTGAVQTGAVRAAAAKASPVDATVAKRLEAILKDQAALPRPSEAGRSIGQAG